MRDENGMALPVVIGLMLVSALLVLAVTAVSLNAVGSASGARASVQSQASAEAGLAVAQANIMAKSYACTFSSPAGSTPVYSVAVQYGADTGGPDCPDLKGNTTAVSAKTAVLISTGSAAQDGIQGHAAGDESRLQGVLTLGAASTATSTPTSTPTPTRSSGGGFTRGVFVGSGGTSLTNSATIDGGTSTTGGLYVNGTLNCSASPSINGATVVWGTLDLQGGGNCAFGNNVTVAGGANSCNGSTITGVLTVRDSGTMSGCTVKGDAYFGGDLSCSGSVTGVLSVQGQVKGGWDCSAGQDLRTGGDLGQNKYTVAGDVVSTSGTISSDAQGSIGSLTVKTKPSSSPGNLKIAGKSCGWGSTPACKITQSSSSSAPPTSPVSMPSSAETMPAVTATTFGAINSTWADFIRSVYASYGGSDGRFASDSAACSITAPTKVQRTGNGDSLDGPVSAPGSTYVVDARGCPDNKMTLRGSTIVLNGDLTILVHDFRSTNGLTVIKGSAVASDVTPVLRIVVPMLSSSSSCASADSAGSITYSNNSKMESDVSVLFYSAGTSSFSDNLDFYGQVYSCKLDSLKNSFAVHYRSLGPSGGSSSASSSSASSSSSPSSSQAGSGGSSGTWTLADVRDLAGS